LTDWQGRLLAERNDLQTRHRKLIDFIQSGKAPTEEIGILTEQWEAMVHLEVILTARIDKFTK